MKKKLLFAAIAAMLFGGCSKNGSIEQPKNSAITFETYVDTKASVVDKDFLKEEGNGFYVSAYYTILNSWDDAKSSVAVPNFMNKQSVQWDATTQLWSYSPLKYWPNDQTGDGKLGKVTFFAVAPAAISELINTTAAPYIAYECPLNNADQTDVLVADVKKDMTSESGNVAFTFRHILSKIAFQAKLADLYSNAEVTINSLKVIYGENGVVNKGDFEMTNGTWNALGADYFTANDADMISSTDKVLNNTSETVNTPISLTDADKYLMLIPQAIESGAVSLEITYSVKDIHRGTTITNVVTKSLPSVTWVKGMQYTYNLDFTLTSVEFGEIVVNDWQDSQN